MNTKDVQKRLKAIEQDPEVLRILEQFENILTRREGAATAVAKLKSDFVPAQVATPLPEQRCWECIGLFYFNSQLFTQAIQVFAALYDHMIKYQHESGERSHKGMPLVWLRDCHRQLNHPVTAKRYAMLTLCEDAIVDIPTRGRINAEGGGIYFRLAFEHGMPDREIDAYAKEVYQTYEKNPKKSLFPEWILQDMDDRWKIEYPTPDEALVYEPNRRYIKLLLGDLGEGTGTTLERLAQYVLDTVPGFRTYRRLLSESTDYDVVCAIEGLTWDFRSELGRYFLCECKDWNRTVDFTTIAKFGRVLDSTKCKAGIIFSKKGVSGEKETKFAAREILKIFQDRGTTILVINQDDLEALTNGANFVVVLRKKYEEIRLDLRER